MARLQLDLPDVTHVFGDRSAILAGVAPGVSKYAFVRVRRPDAFFKKCLLHGDIGFAESYIDGEAHDISWRVQGSGAPYTLVRVVDGGTAVPLLGQLASDQVFTYPDDLSVDISLDLDTHTQDVPIQATVFLRNATTT